MAKKPTISNISSGYASTTTLNNNFTALRDAFDNTLSLDGSTPNSMGADLDMDSNDILNVQDLSVQGLRINGVLIGSSDVVAAGANLTSDDYTGDGSTVTYAMTYNPFTKDNTQVYIDGVYQNKATYSISGLNLTFSEAPPLNSTIEIMVARSLDTLAGTDASNVTYTQSGSATQTTVEAKLQEFISIKDFGAVGNGATDDTASFDNALTAARNANKPLYLPAGTYKRTTVLQIQDNDKFIGDGRKESTIRFVPPSIITACVVPADDTNFTDFCLFENIGLQGDPSTPTNTPIGIWGKSLRTSRFSQMEFNYFSQNCVYLYGQRTAAGGLNPGDSTYNYFEQCRFLSGQDPVRLGGTAGTSRIDSGTSNINTFNKCRFNSATRYGLWMERGANNVFTACSVVSNADTGIRVSWYGNSFIGCVAENNGAYGIRFDNEAETHDNWVFGLHDGGTNVSGLFQDQNNQNYWFATNRGVHLGYESGGSADNYSMYSKSDGNLYWKNSSGTEIKVSNDANKQTVTGSTGGNAALQNLLSALETMGIITDSTT